MTPEKHHHPGEMPMKIDDPRVKKLLAEDEAFRRLYTEHLKYEQELSDLDRAHYLAPEQELRRKTIQKLKLAGKDQMMAMVRAVPG
jgi:uncharacterized protein YdcH (DUF465 family)